MRFKDFITESIIDIPRRTYARGVFDNADTDNPKLKPEVVEMIKKQIEEFEKYHPVKKYSLIGSILTKRYRKDADLDINVLFDIPESERESALEALRKNLKDINGKLVPGTEHPVNYFVIADPKVKEKNDAMADGVFDVSTNKFVRKPKEDTFEPSKYEADFQKKVQEIDITKGELIRDLIDYQELKDLNTNDVLNLQELIGKKLYEIEDALETIVKIGDKTIEDRRDAFQKDMTPDEIRDFGKKNKLPKNVVYKMLEKYHYLTFYKKCKEILDDGKVTDDEIDSLREAPNKSIAFTFGRFNPPTIGHEKLIKKVQSLPTNDYKIYLSRSEDPKKNPLSPRQKLDYMKKMFPSHARNIEINTTNMVLDIATKLYDKGYTDVSMVVGSDRVREFETILKKYNDVKSRHGYYNFNNIKVVSAGERDPDAEGATGMSASKMRAAAAKGDLASFKQGLPSGTDAEKLMKDVRKGMRLAASFGGQMQVGTGARPVASLEEFEQQQIRDLYIREMIFNIGDEVDYVKEDVQGKVVRKGTNYIVVEDNNNNLHKAWIWDCVPIAADREVEVREYNLDVDYGFQAVSEKTEDLDAQPQDKDVKKVKGTQPKKYYKSLSKDVKKKRANYFKDKDTTKNDNRPAPGDKGAKTKPSIHTQKYKKMFGELRADLEEACWSGYKQVGLKKKNGKMVPNCVPEEMAIEDAIKVPGYVPESYEIGADYANHAKDITPGQTADAKPVDSKEKGKVTEKDIKEWSFSDEVIDKYKQRYKEMWRAKLDEVVSKMLEKL